MATSAVSRTPSSSLVSNAGNFFTSTKRSSPSSLPNCTHGRGLYTELTGKRLQISRPKFPLRTKSKTVLPSLAVFISDTGSSRWDSLPSPSSPRSPSERNTKGWTNEQGHEDPHLVAQLRNIAAAAMDRSEMHAIIGIQRDNWNKLCHTTVTNATIAAATLAAINGATPAVSMSVTSFLLNAGAGGLMFLANKFQPSQLAEEQRTAARQFKMLAKEIEATLLNDPRLREDAHLYLENKVARIEALDAAFPLPLTPNGLEKFPKVVRPSVLSLEADLSEPEMPANNSNGWSADISEDLKRTAEKLKQSDIEIYLGWARKKEAENLRLAFAAPSLVFAAALFNIAQCLPLDVHTTTLAAMCSVAAMFCFSFSHGGQIGVIFEMYRNCAGAYSDMDHAIQRTIRVPVCQRENGELFHQRIALQLGRQAELPLVQQGDKTAGKVF